MALSQQMLCQDEAFVEYRFVKRTSGCGFEPQVKKPPRTIERLGG